jgi:hypothetical protein
LVSNFEWAGVFLSLVSRGRVAELVGVGERLHGCRQRSMLGVEGLELDGRDVAERGVQSLGVEPADVVDDRELDLRAGLPDAVCDQLGLEAVDEALGQRVVKRVADGPDRGECLWSSRTCV